MLFAPRAASRLPRSLVSLPYVNSAGVVADDPAAASPLIDRAVELARELNVRHLELRHESEHAHAAFTDRLDHKVHLRLRLPATEADLWKQLHSKVRNQVRKGESHNLRVDWGREELLPPFYSVFSRNMRDLGTPVYGRRLFASILRHLPDQAELCVVRLDEQPIAAALLVHEAGLAEGGTTEVPSASSLRPFNHTNANMLMYWHLLRRAIERGQATFDFGRSSAGSNTYRFKEQWGARPEPAVWQYHVRHGQIGDVRPESGKYQLAIRLWRRLPLGVTRLLGPHIVRGIP